MPPNTKTVVFGLDGAHFELLEPWMEAGHLPNIRRLVETGATADLQSVLPPVTSPNWKAYATGKNPGKIGIFWWENVDVENRRIHYPSERKHHNVEFWELLAEEVPVGVLGVPTTYPPKEIDSFLISGSPDADDDGYTHPSELQAELESEFDYRVNKRYRLNIDRERAVEEIHDLIDLRFTVARHLLAENDVQFLQATTFYINSLHHYLWDDEQTLQGWKIVDRHLGALADEYDVVLMSDHGSTAIDSVFHLNTWLEREGYLQLDSGVADRLYDLGVTKKRLVWALSKLHLKETARRIVPPRIRHLFPNERGEVKQEGKTDLIDWDTSDAVASGQGVIYLLADDPRRKSELQDELADELSSLRTPDGMPVASAIHEGEAVYDGEFADEAPDLVLEQTEGLHIPGSLGRNEVFSTPAKDGWRAENKRRGLFVANGPSFSASDLGTVSILDLAPMFLHLYGRPIPRDLDGEVPISVFAEGSEPRQRENMTVEATELSDDMERIDDENLRDKLSDLGYVE